MNSFDGRMLSVLKDGNPRDFRQLLSEVGFTHNILRTRLTNLEKLKAPHNSKVRPFSFYLVCKAVIVEPLATEIISSSTCF